MNQRRLAIFGVALASVFTAPAFARTGYRIVLTNGVTIVAADEPVRRGTILTFHQATSGTLTGIPAEQVTSVDLDTAPVRPRPLARTTLTPTPAAVRPLEPGETLVIGATGDGIALPAAVQNAGPATNPGANNVNVPPAYGGGSPALYGGSNVPLAGAANAATTNGLGPNGLPTAPSSTDLSQALASTTGANGFPANPTTSPTTIGPNGTPTLSPGMPGANTTIGPNGTPVTAGTAQPVTGANGTPVIGSNGTPVVAQPGAFNPASPNIGPNGTPTLAQPGAPGGTPPQIGPNGTPILAPPGGPGSAQPNTAPNGTPGTPPNTAASSPHP